jgi:hypothetical protein
MLRLQLARGGGLVAFGLAVELAAGEDHLVDPVGAVGEAQHTGEAPRAAPLAFAPAQSLTGGVESRKRGRVLRAPELLLRGDHLVDRDHAN